VPPAIAESLLPSTRPFSPDMLAHPSVLVLDELVEFTWPALGTIRVVTWGLQNFFLRP
jgi:hypothetical protein